MKILLTGATGYIGKRLLPALLEQGHHVVCCVRDKARFRLEEYPLGQVSVVEADLLNSESLRVLPADIDGAYYLVHSMSSASGDFTSAEAASAENFKNYLNTTRVRHVVYLGGISNDKNLSKHLSSRKKVGEILSSGTYPCTTVRAGIIIGSGSASFEIIRDLVEKLPVMIAPKWLHTKSQPIAIRDIIELLVRVLWYEKAFGKDFDAGGPDVLTYKQMLLSFAEVRKLRRWIITVPVLTPRLSSYWLYFVTSTTFSLASTLVDSMKVEIVCKENELMPLLGIKPLGYAAAVIAAFQQIEQNTILSSWKDSLISGRMNDKLNDHIQVPVNGCFLDTKERKVIDKARVINRVWAIGGETGWYYGNMLWHLRGFTDKLFGGVGLRRGRTSGTMLSAGDTLDFWRVLFADKERGRLLLYAEMKLPGEAWLEFRVSETTIRQTATFRPRGVWGRLYWYSVMPFHFFIFNGMIRKLSE